MGVVVLVVVVVVVVVFVVVVVVDVVLVQNGPVPSNPVSKSLHVWVVGAPVYPVAHVTTHVAAGPGNLPAQSLVTLSWPRTGS
mmetsp:Transcript_35974/g.115322  ORF Transcript_35974/g.115322 Transcript_35974/m.115322 type:complete len:83 (-) Transcript_35974:17-265(-)